MNLRTARAFLPGSILLVLLFLSLTAIALDVPPLRGRVNDYAGLMSPERIQTLEERLARFGQESGHQVAVLTIPSLQGEDIDGFGIRVAENWKIGKKKFDNGAILIISKNDRKLRIEVGYGLEGVLPDAIASRIIREVIVPRFRDGDFAGGIEAGVETILKVTSGEPLPEPAQVRSRRKNSGSLDQILFILFLLAVPLVGVLSNLSQRRAYGAWSGAGRNRAAGRGGFFWGGFGGGGFGGGGFGGGGFSGGGGGFGGGGASGSW